MLFFKVIKEFDFKCRIPARIFAWLILLCICYSSLPTFGQQSSKSDDLVFCPIQKLWVEKYVPPVKIKAPLDDICASSGEKSRFFFEMSKRTPLLRLIHESEQVEKIFFNYLKKGKQAFAELVPSQNIPEQQFARLTAAQKSTGGSNYKADLDKIQSKVFTLAQAARPPTARQSVSFETANFRLLETISRRIQPRAPPVRS